MSLSFLTRIYLYSVSLNVYLHAVIYFVYMYIYLIEISCTNKYTCTNGSDSRLGLWRSPQIGIEQKHVIHALVIHKHKYGNMCFTYTQKYQK